MMSDKPFANLRNLIAGSDERLPRHGTPQPKQPENRDDARKAMMVIHKDDDPYDAEPDFDKGVYDV